MTLKIEKPVRRSLVGAALATLLFLGTSLPLHADPTDDSTVTLVTQARTAVASVLVWIDSLGDAPQGSVEDEAGVDIEPNG